MNEINQPSLRYDQPVHLELLYLLIVKLKKKLLISFSSIVFYKLHDLILKLLCHSGQHFQHMLYVELRLPVIAELRYHFVHYLHRFIYLYFLLY